MNLALPRIVCTLIAALLFLPPLPTAASSKDSTANTEATLFEFHGPFWRNLHHTLYAFASNAATDATRTSRIRLDPDDIAIADALAGAERATWQHAVAWYAANLSRRDLLFDAGMVAIGDALNADGTDAPSGTDVPAALRDVLQRAAPVYRARWWPRHRQANADWQAALEPLLAAHGPQIASRLSRAYDIPWFDAPVPATLTAYSNWAGAYAALAPTRVNISTLDRRNQGTTTLEIAMHEASHGLIEPLEEKLDALVVAEAARPGADAAAVRPDLWHEILFYVAGKLVADAVPGYVAYADSNKLWGRVWSERDRTILARHLDPYLAGSGSLDSALQGLVRDLMSKG